MFKWEEYGGYNLQNYKNRLYNLTSRKNKTHTLNRTWKTFLKYGCFFSGSYSNAWFDKEYGFHFKKFLLNNFHIKYIVKSNGEHWFADSQVSTIYTVLQKKIRQ